MMLEGRPGHKLHGDISQIALLGHIVNGDDAGMRENARGARLAKQALALLATLIRVAEFAEADRLDGDFPAYGRIQSAVHDAHGAAPEFTQDLISADLLHFRFDISNLAR